jgi:hypothetical protein
MPLVFVIWLCFSRRCCYITVAVINETHRLWKLLDWIAQGGLEGLHVHKGRWGRDNSHDITRRERERERERKRVQSFLK